MAEVAGEDGRGVIMRSWTGTRGTDVGYFMLLLLGANQEVGMILGQVDLASRQSVLLRTGSSWSVELEPLSRRWRKVLLRRVCFASVAQAFGQRA